LLGETKAISYVYSKLQQEVTKEELRKLLELYIYVCNCGAEYDEVGMEILFKDLPDDFKCPNCNGSKKGFKKKGEE